MPLFSIYYYSLDLSVIIIVSRAMQHIQHSTYWVWELFHRAKMKLEHTNMLLFLHICACTVCINSGYFTINTNFLSIKKASNLLESN
jgi:hypothetical protein